MHVEVKPKPIRIQSINANNGSQLNDLEAALLCFQRLIREKHKQGKKGMTLYKDTESEYKMSYKKLQALLFEIHTIFAMKGTFSYGICGDCKNFDNAKSGDGCYGICKGQTKWVFDSCNEHNGIDGFGL